MLELFGYMVTTPPPTEEEIAWACNVCQRELHEVAFPAYVLDCTHRLIAWNAHVPRLFGIAAADPTLGGLAGRSILAAWFDPASPLAGRGGRPLGLHGARCVEAYPLDAARKLSSGELYVGRLSTFQAAGFVEVLRRAPTRPIVRRDVSSACPRS